MKKYKLAVVGATGMVGRTMLKVLEERSFPVLELVPFASKASAGKSVEFGGKSHTVLELTRENILAAKPDIALFSAGATVSGEYAPIFAENGALVIDNSSRWRTDENVPLVVPEVNGKAIFRHRGIIANPNCSTIQAVVALKPLYDFCGIKRIVYTTFQAVSGAGMLGYEDLENGIKGIAPKKFPRSIAYNCIPHIDVFTENGYTKEEEKMIFETKKILGDFSIAITATCVRVPVYYGHSESINVELNAPITAEKAKELLSGASGVTVMDDAANGVYPTALDAAGKDGVFVGRIRLDTSVKNGLNFWAVADNIRKGAALNAVQIAEAYILGQAE